MFLLVAQGVNRLNGLKVICISIAHVYKAIYLQYIDFAKFVADLAIFVVEIEFMFI